MDKNFGHIVTMGSAAGVNGLVYNCTSIKAHCSWAVFFTDDGIMEFICVLVPSASTVECSLHGVRTWVIFHMTLILMLLILMQKSNNVVDCTCATDKMITAVLTNQHLLMIPRILYQADYLKSYISGIV